MTDDDTPGPRPPDLVQTGVPCKLNRKIIKGWYWSGILGSIAFAGGGLLAEYFWLSEQDWWPLPMGVAAAAVGLFILALGLITPVLAWRHWTYTIREHDVLMEFGIVWKTSRSVPRLRIQHVDVKIDPIDRLLGLASVTLYTAGSSGEDAEIPGLLPEIAEAIREELLITSEMLDALPTDDTPPVDAAGTAPSDGDAPPGAPGAPHDG